MEGNLFFLRCLVLGYIQTFLVKKDRTDVRETGSKSPFSASSPLAIK